MSFLKSFHILHGITMMSYQHIMLGVLRHRVCGKPEECPRSYDTNIKHEVEGTVGVEVPCVSL